MTNNINALLEKLKKVSAKGKGQWTACCPAHEDRSPSLAIREVPDGRILLKCFAGCAAADVMHSVGMTLSDLFPDGEKHEFKPFAFAQAERRKEEKAKEDIREAELVIAMGDAMRERGEKLSQADLDREMQAFKTLKGLL